MSHKPMSMKTLSRLSQKPMLNSEKPVKTSTTDLMHAAELARRSTIQRTSNVKPRPESRKKHMPKSANQPISKPAGKLDAQLQTLDRSHINRQNAKAVPVKMSTKPPKR